VGVGGQRKGGSVGTHFKWSRTDLGGGGLRQ